MSENSNPWMVTLHHIYTQRFSVYWYPNEAIAIQNSIRFRDTGDYDVYISCMFHARHAVRPQNYADTREIRLIERET